MRRSSRAAAMHCRFSLLVSLILVLGAAGCTSVPDETQSDFDFNKDAFTFSNFGTDTRPSRMTDALAIRMFGRDAVCQPMATDPNVCEVRPEALAWLAEVNETLAFGHSEGMAVTSLLISLGKVNVSDFGATSAATLTANNELFVNELSYWSATQKLEAAHSRDERFAAKDVMPFLAKALKPGNADAWRLLIAMREGDSFRGGHALVPFGYFKGSRDGQYFLRLYDSNMPQTETRLEINTLENTWLYEGSFDTSIQRTYVGNPENGNLLWFSPVTSRLGTFTPPFAEGATMTVASTGASVKLEGDTAFVGFQDGKLVEKGGRLIPAAADCLCKLPNEIINIQVSPDAGSGPQKISVTGNGLSTEQNVTVSAPGVSVTAKNINAANSSDSVTIDSAGKSVTYNTGGDSKIDLTTSVKQSDGSTTTVKVTVGNITREVKIDAADPSNVKVNLDDMPAGTTVTVSVTRTEANGTSKTTTATATTQEGRDAQVSVQPIAGTATTNTNINFEPCLNGVKDVNEADVDCGAACAAKPSNERSGTGQCALAKACGTTADCQPASNVGCFFGKCARATCADGLKNGAETGVDCGYCDLEVSNAYKACGMGQACLFDDQCVAGLKCANRTCFSAYNHTLRVVGLGVERGNLNIKVIADGTQKGGSFTGQSDGTPRDALYEFKAAGSFTVTVSQQLSDFNCVFDGSQSTTWSWSNAVDGGAGASAQSETLRCTRVNGNLYFTARNSCPNVVDNAYLQGSLQSINVSLYRNGAPSSASAQIWGSPASGGFGALTKQPDGGRAYMVQGTSPAYIDRSISPGYPNAGRVFRQQCQVVDAGSGLFPTNLGGFEIISVDCTCTAQPDGGFPPFDAGTPSDAGSPVDAGSPFDAGSSFDAGAPFDAGVPDAGPNIGAVCTSDSQCTTNDCYCGVSSGSCTANSGHCGAGKIIISAPTSDGIAQSGTFTVPASCTSVQMRAWGAAGGGSQESGPFGGGTGAGSGGYVTGTLPVAAGDVFTFWVGSGGTTATASGGVVAPGSYLGTPANGGAGDGAFNQSFGGSGGGLTSASQTGSASVAFAVPAGGGAGVFGFGEPAGGTGAGGNTTYSGENAASGSFAGGGGAGQNGGLAGINNSEPGSPGAYGTLPSGLSSVTNPSPSDVPDNGTIDYLTCPIGSGVAPGSGGTGGSGCIVVRCANP